MADQKDMADAVLSSPEARPRRRIQFVAASVLVILVIGGFAMRAWEAWGPISGLPSNRTTRLQGPSFSQRLSRGEVSAKELRDHYAELAQVELEIKAEPAGLRVTLNGVAQYSVRVSPVPRLNICTNIDPARTPTFFLDGRELDWARGIFSSMNAIATISYGIHIDWPEFGDRETATIRVVGVTTLVTDDETMTRHFERMNNEFPFEFERTIDIASLRKRNWKNR